MVPQSLKRQIIEELRGRKPAKNSTLFKQKAVQDSNKPLFVLIVLIPALLVAIFAFCCYGRYCNKKPAATVRAIEEETPSQRYFVEEFSTG